MSGGLAALRLIEERKSFRKDHPPGFFARPCIKSDGSTNIMVSFPESSLSTNFIPKFCLLYQEWVAGITGPEGSDWEGGLFTLKMVFGSDYPVVPPSISFSPPIFHPNVFASGAICLSILKQEDGWRPAVTIKQILLAIQDLLINANEHSPANCEAATLMVRKPSEYIKRIKLQAMKFATADNIS